MKGIFGRILEEALCLAAAFCAAFFVEWLLWDWMVATFEPLSAAFVIIFGVAFLGVAVYIMMRDWLKGLHEEEKR